MSEKHSASDSLINEALADFTAADRRLTQAQHERRRALEALSFQYNQAVNHLRPVQEVIKASTAAAKETG